MYDYYFGINVTVHVLETFNNNNKYKKNWEVIMEQMNNEQRSNWFIIIRKGVTIKPDFIRK